MLYLYAINIVLLLCAVALVAAGAVSGVVPGGTAVRTVLAEMSSNLPADLTSDMLEVVNMHRHALTNRLPVDAQCVRRLSHVRHCVHVHSSSSYSPSLSSPHCRHGIQAVEYAPTSLVIIGIVLAAIACAGCCSSFSSGVTG